MHLNDALYILSQHIGIDSATLIAYAAEDTVGGFEMDETVRKWPVGSMWGSEGQFVYAAVRALKPDLVLEAGVSYGCSATHILTALEANSKGRLISLDIYQSAGSQVPDNLKVRWQFEAMDAVSYIRQYAPQADIVLEDLLHDVAGTTAFLNAVRETMNPRLVLSHDAEHQSVGREVQASWGNVHGEFSLTRVDPSDCGFAWKVFSGYSSISLPAVTRDQPIVWQRSGKQRILYLPIIEPGAKHEIALACKHGLRDALAQYGDVKQIDYMALPMDEVRSQIVDFAPDILFTQLHGPDHLTAADLRAIRAQFPQVRIVNWNGDYHPHSLTSPAMLELLKEVDLQLVINGDVLPTYAEHGINAAYWQFGYETALGELPSAPAYDVVYLGTNYSEKRKELGAVLRGLKGCSVGIYGMGWTDADGECTYDFAIGEALYQNARIAISDNQWPESDGYVSNRPFQAMYAGCFVLQQRIANAEARLGMVDGVHVVMFDEVSEIPALVTKWLKKGNEPRRRKIAKAGQALVIDQHSFEERVRTLFDELLPEVSRAD